MVALAAVIVATASATQDIVIDAFRVEYLPTENQAAGMAYFVAAYRIGMLVSTAGVVALVAYLEYQRRRSRSGLGLRLCRHGRAGGGWHGGGADRARSRKPRSARRKPKRRASGPAIRSRASSAPPMPPSPISSPRRDALLILLFVVLYKLTDTFAGVMTGPFVLDIGFDKASYAAIVKGVG